MTAVERYFEALDRYEAARARADAAFARYFAKREACVRTNGAAWQRLENEANYLSAELHQAEGHVFDENGELPTREERS